MSVERDRQQQTRLGGQTPSEREIDRLLHGLLPPESRPAPSSMEFDGAKSKRRNSSQRLFVPDDGDDTIDDETGQGVRRRHTPQRHTSSQGEDVPLPSSPSSPAPQSHQLDEPLYHVDDLCAFIWNTQQHPSGGRSTDDGRPDIVSRNVFLTFSRKKCVVYCLERAVALEVIEGGDVQHVHCVPQELRVDVFGAPGRSIDSPYHRVCWTAMTFSCPTKGACDDTARGLESLRVGFLASYTKTTPPRAAMEEALLLQHQARLLLSRSGERAAGTAFDSDMAEVNAFEQWKVRSQRDSQMSRRFAESVLLNSSPITKGVDDFSRMPPEARVASSPTRNSLYATARQRASAEEKRREKMSPANRRSTSTQTLLTSRPNVGSRSSSPRRAADAQSPDACSVGSGTQDSRRGSGIRRVPVAQPSSSDNNSGEFSTVCRWCMKRCPPDHERRCVYRLRSKSSESNASSDRASTTDASADARTPVTANPTSTTTSVASVDANSGDNNSTAISSVTRALSVLEQLKRERQKERLAQIKQEQEHLRRQESARSIPRSTSSRRVLRATSSQETEAVSRRCRWCALVAPESHDRKCAFRKIRCTKCSKVLLLKEQQDHKLQHQHER